MEKLLQQLRTAMDTSGRNYNREKVEAAFWYAADLHAGQVRLSGEPYVSHPVAVAEIVILLGLDTDSVCAALLHDTVEDCADKTNLDVLKEKFGADVAMLVDGLTKLVLIDVEDKQEANIENIRKMLLAMSKDIRVNFATACITCARCPQRKRTVSARSRWKPCISTRRLRTDSVSA